MSNEKKIYFATKGFILNEGKFLIMHKKENGVWELPGGRMEFGEAAEDTIVREIAEETGLKIKPVRLLDTWNYIARDYQITGIIYLCEIISGEVTLSEEHDRFEWVDADGTIVEKLVNVFKERMIKWNWSDIY